MEAMKFIYVFSDEAREAMLQAGFSYVCEDMGSHAYVFLTDEHLRIPDEVGYTVTTRLAFAGDGK